MFNRLWAILLILICGFNAIGVSGAAFLSEEGTRAIAVSSSASDVDASHHSGALSFGPQSSTPDSSASLTSSSEESHSDCGSSHADCHLGHCSFVVSDASGLLNPERVIAAPFILTPSYLSISLSGPSKPPRA